MAVPVLGRTQARAGVAGRSRSALVLRRNQRDIAGVLISAASAASNRVVQRTTRLSAVYEDLGRDVRTQVSRLFAKVVELRVRRRGGRSRHHYWHSLQRGITVFPIVVDLSLQPLTTRHAS